MNDFIQRKHDGTINLCGTVREYIRTNAGAIAPADFRVMLWLSLTHEERVATGTDTDTGDDALFTLRQIKTAFYLVGMRACRPARAYWHHPVNELARQRPYAEATVDDLVRWAAFEAYTGEGFRQAEAKTKREREYNAKIARSYARRAAAILGLAGRRLEGKVH